MSKCSCIRIGSGRRAVATIAAFFVTLFALQLVVANWLGEPRCEALEAKWREFERQADDYAIVFIGTSHVQRHIDPRVVDRTLAEHGLDVRSYNFGLPKMSMLEGAAVIERLAKRRPRSLQLVVIEPTLYLYDAENWATDRALAEHDRASTARAIGLTWGSELRRRTNIWGRLAAVWPHTLSFFCRSLGLRRGELLFALPQKMGETVDSPPSDLAGFSPLPLQPVVRVERPDWELRFARFLTIEPDWRGPGLSAQEIAYFDQQLAIIRGLDAQPVWLLGPKVKRDSHTAAVLHTHRQRYSNIPLLNYLRGCGHSEIYQLPYWHDFEHLNAKGADLFSRRLAVRLVPLLQR